MHRSSARLVFAACSVWGEEGCGFGCIDQPCTRQRFTGFGGDIYDHSGKRDHTVSAVAGNHARGPESGSIIDRLDDGFYGFTQHHRTADERHNDLCPAVLVSARSLVFRFLHIYRSVKRRSGIVRTELHNQFGDGSGDR